MAPFRCFIELHSGEIKEKGNNLRIRIVSHEDEIREDVCVSTNKSSHNSKRHLFLFGRILRLQHFWFGKENERIFGP